MLTIFPYSPDLGLCLESNLEKGVEAYTAEPKQTSSLGLQQSRTRYMQRVVWEGGEARLGP
jgi:hypothetical protein